jgi:hypothetical protein
MSRDTIPDLFETAFSRPKQGHRNQRNGGQAQGEEGRHGRTVIHVYE